MPIVQTAPEPETSTAPAPEPRLGIGGNSPPQEEIIADQFREELLRNRPEFMRRMDDAIAAVGRAEVKDDDTLKRAGDLENILRACDNHIAETHKAVKEPYLSGGRIVDAEKNRLVGQITPARLDLRNKMNEFVARREAVRRAEEQRLLAEQRAKAEAAQRAAREAEEAERAAARALAEASSEAERLAATEAATQARLAARELVEDAALAAHTPAKAEPVRSDAGSTVSTRTVWNSEVEDYKFAVRSVLDDAKVREAIEGAIGRLVKAGKREIKGVRVWPTQQAMVR